MKKTLLNLGALLVAASAFADAPDFGNFDNPHYTELAKVQGKYQFVDGEKLYFNSVNDKGEKVVVAQEVCPAHGKGETLTIAFNPNSLELRIGDYRFSDLNKGLVEKKNIQHFEYCDGSKISSGALYTRPARGLILRQSDEFVSTDFEFKADGAFMLQSRAFDTSGIPRSPQYERHEDGFNPRNSYKCWYKRL